MTSKVPGKCLRCAINGWSLLLQLRMIDMHIDTTLQGGMDILENPFNTAERELLEETGISSITFLAQVALVMCLQI